MYVVIFWAFDFRCEVVIPRRIILMSFRQNHICYLQVCLVSTTNNLDSTGNSCSLENLLLLEILRLYYFGFRCALWLLEGYFLSRQIRNCRPPVCLVSTTKVVEFESQQSKLNTPSDANFEACPSKVKVNIINFLSVVFV